MKRFFVFIIANRGRMLYVGMTNNIRRRIREHRGKRNPKSHSARWNIRHLVYYEVFNYVWDAIHREKQIKSWRREKKIALIESVNPHWWDLSAAWD